MPFRDLRSWLYDIAEAIEDIEDFTLGMDFESFKGDPKTVAAVERKIARIGEAAVRLDDDGPALCPELPWSDIRGIGNWLRHQYDRVDLGIIWKTIETQLPPLKASVSRALADNPDID